jgi:hypothetical protein
MTARPFAFLEPTGQVGMRREVSGKIRLAYLGYAREASLLLKRLV